MIHCYKTFLFSPDGIFIALVLIITSLLFYVFKQISLIRDLKQRIQLMERQKGHLIKSNLRLDEAKRKRMAHTLRDEVGTLLSSAKLHLQGMSPDQADSLNGKLYLDSIALLDKAIQLIRETLRDHNL